MKRYFPLLILFGCAAAFAFGVVYLFDLRFDAGDVYPPYSSLRADPLGAMALYESLEKIPGINVRRDFSNSDSLPAEPQTVYLHLAGDPYEFDFVSQETYRNIQDFLTRGGRLVITFFPQTEDFWFNESAITGTNSEPKKMTKSKSDKHNHDNHDTENDDNSWLNMSDKWKFHVAFQKLEQKPDGFTYAPATVFNQSEERLPDTLDWHSGIVFTNLGSAWRVIYSRGGNAVLIEREFGRGSVVIASDSYLLSNEAMLKDRHADLLAWLLGPAKNVVFDETHFGIVETPGVAALMRKYHLEGLAIGLIVLAGLFIWKNAFSLVPPLADPDAERFIVGKDSASGFVNLLRRGIAPRYLLATCFEEWKKSTKAAQSSSLSRFQQAEAIFAAEQATAKHGPVDTYNKISETLGNQNQKL
ncbi:MAG TPA: DUF4350 domain-containing protein [Candidatus Sulfotelmatobacter sp.]|nr:DUF4350 domain-containing protein [Candidatus Sulfotelmatobacter sp.]